MAPKSTSRGTPKPTVAAPDEGGTVRPHPAWADLDAAGRVEAYEATLRARAIEAAPEPDGLSTTARSILARIDRAEP